MLSEHCPVCLSVCPCVMLVYCGQTVGWIKMKLGTDVGLGLGVGAAGSLPRTPLGLTILSQSP